MVKNRSHIPAGFHGRIISAPYKALRHIVGICKISRDVEGAVPYNQREQYTVGADDLACPR